MSTEYPFKGQGTTEKEAESKSALDYLHELHQWHDKYFGLSTLLETIVVKEFPGYRYRISLAECCIDSGIRGAAQNSDDESTLASLENLKRTRSRA